MNESEVFRLVREDMERAEQEMRRIIDMAMFRSEAPPMFQPFYCQPNPWWKWRVWWPVQYYLWNLWRAVIGRTNEYDDE